MHLVEPRADCRLDRPVREQAGRDQKAGSPVRCSSCLDDPYQRLPRRVGSTQQDPQRFARLIDDVEQRLFGTLPDDTRVYPGHGRDTTLGAERPHREA
jgi:hypothetical protein